MSGQREKLRTINTERRSFQGVLNILDFNRHFYFWGVGLLLAVPIIGRLIGLSNKIQMIGILIILIGLLIPLIASVYVYDLANYYQLKWLEKLLPNLNNEKVANIHAGFDETSVLLKKRFPDLDLISFDFYDPKNHTEAAIIRARKKSLPIQNSQTISTKEIEQQNETYDYIFFLSALHEVRKREEKIAFLLECKRVLKDEGNIVVVEHLRNTPNFIAFHIGFFHFFSKKEWKLCFEKAGLDIITEKNHTPLLTIFNLKKI